MTTVVKHLFGGRVGGVAGVAGRFVGGGFGSIGGIRGYNGGYNRHGTYPKTFKNRTCQKRFQL
jgi:hypothetical protein